MGSTKNPILMSDLTPDQPPWNYRTPVLRDVKFELLVEYWLQPYDFWRVSVTFQGLFIGAISTSGCDRKSVLRITRVQKIGNLPF